MGLRGSGSRSVTCPRSAPLSIAKFSYVSGTVLKSRELLTHINDVVVQVEEYKKISLNGPTYDPVEGMNPHKLPETRRKHILVGNILDRHLGLAKNGR